VLLAAVPVLAACSDDSAPAVEEPPPSTAPRPTSLYDLEVGQCFDGLAANQDVRVQRVPCRRPHQAEVYGLVTVSARRFPGADELRLEAATQCAQRFAAYTGEPAGPGTEVAFTEVVPTLASWAAGDRTALCLALGINGALLTGSIAAGGAA
jgi:hypothetical protein